ncbi:acetyltransferase [Chromatiaceae bacterium AAb-1]|nr:acetyltransferase [Chromatiaceae bacterium AAb-1]
MSPQTEHWAEKPENGSYLGIRILLGLYRYGGKWLMLLCLAPVTAYFFLKDRRARQASMQFLTRVHQFSADASPFRHTPGYWQSYCHFWQFSLAALAKIDAWIGRLSADKDVTRCGDIQFGDMVASGKGGIIISSHLGNTEVCRALVTSRYPTRINVLTFTRHAAAFNQALKDANRQVDLNLIQVDNFTPDLAIMLKERTEQGEFVVIVGDRISANVPERSVWAEFIGQPAPFAVGPWVLASVLECPAYLMFCIKTPQQYQLIFETFAPQINLPRKTRQQQLQHYISRYASRLEQQACRYPLQWFNFYDFWQLPSASQHKESSR